ncbi:MAG: ABC transporter permease [Armatimonadota bacterium]
MKGIWTIAKMSLLENSRKQIFHVVCILMSTVIAGSTLLSVFTEGVKIKMLKDMSMTCILFSGAILAIVLGATSIPNDLESRAAYPILARPLTRARYVIGKFLGTLLTVTIATVTLSMVFGAVIYYYQKRVDGFLFIASTFAIFEAAVIASVATFLSVITTPAVSAVVTFMAYVLGTIKISHIGSILERTSNSIVKMIISAVYHLLPNLECFNLKAALVHADVIPKDYLALVTFYAVAYVGFMLFAGTVLFRRKEI